MGGKGSGILARVGRAICLDGLMETCTGRVSVSMVQENPIASVFWLTERACAKRGSEMENGKVNNINTLVWLPALS